MKYHQYLMINMHHQMMINMILIISDEGRVVGRVAAYLRHQMMISHICSIQTPSDRIFPTFDKVRGGRLYCKGRNSHFWRSLLEENLPRTLLTIIKRMLEILQLLEWWNMILHLDIKSTNRCVMVNKFWCSCLISPLTFLFTSSHLWSCKSQQLWRWNIVWKPIRWFLWENLRRQSKHQRVSIRAGRQVHHGSKKAPMHHYNMDALIVTRHRHRTQSVKTSQHSLQKTFPAA